jgi:hypothetical protein
MSKMGFCMGPTGSPVFTESHVLFRSSMESIYSALKSIV